MGYSVGAQTLCLATNRTIIKEASTMQRPIPPDALAALRSVADVCFILRAWGRPDLAHRLAYFASDEDLDDGDVPLTLESARGFLAFFLEVEWEGEVSLGCSTEGWICAEWDFPDRRDVGLWFLDDQRLMYTARGADGRFMDLNNDGSRVGARVAITEKLVQSGLFTWFNAAQPASRSHTRIT